MEEPANKSNGAFTSQNSSLSSLDYSDLTLPLPALPASEAGGREVRTQRRELKKHSHHHMLYTEINSVCSSSWKCHKSKQHKNWCKDHFVFFFPNGLLQDKGSALFGSPAPTPQDQRYGYAVMTSEEFQIMSNLCTIVHHLSRFF